MKIVILNGNDDPHNRVFEDKLAQLGTTLQAAGHTSTCIDLRDLKMSYCIGCFGCWVKTPGECVTRDESALVCRAVINSDFTLWAAPLKIGFPSALLKKVMDKSIPLIHPYFAIVNNEAHHRARYGHYPRLGLLVQPEADTDSADMELVTDIFSRTALNMKSRLEFALTTDAPVEDIARCITQPTKGGATFEKHPAPIPGVQVNPPCSLTLFNGSPRGRKANTAILLEQFAAGCRAGGMQTLETIHLNRMNQMGAHVQAFAQAECVWLGFPLYTDAMPGMVKAFIEALAPLRNRPNNPPIGFLVQSGFPESSHSRHVERYLEKFAARLGSPYLGTIVKGGCEGVRMMPDNMNRKLFSGLQKLGGGFATSGRLDASLLYALAKPEYYSPLLTPLFKLAATSGLISFYWDGMLKQNGAYELRFARPYQNPE